MKEQQITNEENEWFMKELYPHETHLRRWLLGRFSSIESVDDIIQSAYVRTIQRKRKRHISSPKTFLFSVARNLCIDFLRRKKIVPFESIDSDHQFKFYDKSKGVEDRVILKEELEMLMVAIGTLPKKCRRVFTLRKVYGMSHHQIANELNISTKTVENQISIGMKKCHEYYMKLQEGINR